MKFAVSVLAIRGDALPNGGKMMVHQCDGVMTNHVKKLMSLQVFVIKKKKELIKGG
jgi:hypothetical protein